MKKNLYKIIIAIICVLLILLILIIHSSLINKVSKFSSVTIVNSLNKEVKDYKKNTLPFTIKYDKDYKVYVNGEEYNNERIYKPGNYTIKVKGKNIETSTVSINKVTKKNTYKIYTMTETLQALIGNLDLSKDVDQKAYVWTAKSGTINLDNVKVNHKNVTLSKYSGSTIPSANEFHNTVVEEIKNYVKTALNNDDNSCFEMYIHEADFYLALEIFDKLGLDDSRYNIIMYTDGTKGYVRDYEITKKNVYNNFKNMKNFYFNLSNNVKKNKIDSSTKEYMTDGEYKFIYGTLKIDYMLISALKNNVQLLLQFPEAREYKDNKVDKEMKKAHIYKFTMQDKFNELNDKQKKIFFNNINLNKSELDNNYFSDDKDYLIITGTVPFYGSSYSKEKFEKIINIVVKDYGEKYTILYKPHPRALPTEEQEKFLNDLNIKVLPGQIPMEAISFVYPNLKLGGFVSSLYMNVDKGKTLFFFTKDKNDLVAPINTLYDSLFKNAKFYN